jgi:predicted DNA binding CopG/RHH family protein
MKKVAFASKPEQPTQNLDEWVSREPETQTTTKKTETKPEKTTRLTVDVPISLHRRVKTQCASEGLKMADVLRELLEKHFPEKA